MEYAGTLQQEPITRQEAGRFETLERIFTDFWGWSLAALAVYVFVTNSPLWILWEESWFGLFDVLDFIAIGLSVIIGVVMAVRLETKRRKFEDTEKYRYQMTAVVRYLLAYIFLVYGFAKVFGQQFYSTPSTLDTPVGDLSGIQLTWRFFGYSYAYTLFVAGSQIVGATLLLFRRTTLLGAVVLFSVVSNIVFVNFTHQIPVKLYSSFYLVMLAFLLFLDFRRLKALFWDDRTALQAAPAYASHATSSRRQRVVKALVITLFFVSTIAENYYANLLDKLDPAMKGVWEVREHRVNGAVLTGSDPTAWQKVYFNFDFQVAVKTAEAKPKAYLSKLDQQKRTIRLEDNITEELFAEGSYELLAAGEIILNLRSGEDLVQVTLKKVR